MEAWKRQESARSLHLELQLQWFRIRPRTTIGGEHATTAKDGPSFGHLVLEVLITVGILGQACGKGLRQLSGPGLDEIDSYRGPAGVNASVEMSVATVGIDCALEISQKSHGVVSRVLMLFEQQSLDLRLLLLRRRCLAIPDLKDSLKTCHFEASFHRQLTERTTLV